MIIFFRSIYNKTIIRFGFALSRIIDASMGVLQGNLVSSTELKEILKLVFRVLAFVGLNSSSNLFVKANGSALTESKRL